MSSDFIIIILFFPPRTNAAQKFRQTASRRDRRTAESGSHFDAASATDVLTHMFF